MLAEHVYRNEIARADTLQTLERACMHAGVPYEPLRACLDIVVRADVDGEPADGALTCVLNAYVDLRFVATSLPPDARIVSYGAPFSGSDKDAHDAYLAAIEAMATLNSHAYETLQDDRTHPRELLANEEYLGALAGMHQEFSEHTPEYPTEQDVVRMIDDLLDIHAPLLHLLEAHYQRHVALGVKGIYRFSIPGAPLPGPTLVEEQSQQPF